MTLYAYKAMNEFGRKLRGRIDAINLDDLEMRLKHMGLDFIRGTPVSHGQPFGHPVCLRELINFCFHLEQLTRSGVPIIDGLADLRDSLAHTRFRAVLASLIESVEGGKTLSQAMAQHPRIFDEVFISLVHAGEETGKLPDVLKSLVDSIKWQDETASHTKKLILYPAFLGSVVLAVTFFMMIYLVPKMTSFIRSMGQELPLQTQILIACSDFFVNFWIALLISPILFIIAGKLALGFSAEARYRFDSFKLRIPIAGDIQRKIIFSRFAAVFAMMYGAGISIIDTLHSTEKVVGNAFIKAGLTQAGRMIAEGQNVSSAFQSAGLFPPLVIRMLQVGESTGGLDTALENVSYFYSRDVHETIERAQTLLEPVLTLVIGLMLGWVMLSVLGPIYDVITQLKT